MSRLIIAIALALSLVVARQASAGGYYDVYPSDYYHGDYGYYAPHYHPYYPGYYEPSYETRLYYGPVPFFSALFGPGPRCQHRVPVQNFQGELRDGWVSGC